MVLGDTARRSMVRMYASAMPTSTCVCGARIEAGDVDGLVAGYLKHAADAHPGLDLTEGNVRDYIEAEQRMTGGTERFDDIGAVEVHEATPDRLDDLLRFFDHDAFAGNPAWAGCYCMAHHVSADSDWGGRRAAENRSDLVQRVRSRTTTGLLAYADGRPAAWCNASPRSAFPHYAGRDDHPDDEVGSIVCFVVAPPYRRHGLASRLLEAACGSFASRGFRLAEAYPAPEPRGDAGAYHGPLGMYLGAGFERVGTLGDLVVVQKPL